MLDGIASDRQLCALQRDTTSTKDKMSKKPHGIVSGSIPYHK
jgi:hypothetical protein